MIKFILFSLLFMTLEWVTAQQTKTKKMSRIEELNFKNTDDQSLPLDSVNRNESVEYAVFTVPRQPEFPWIRGTLERYISIHLQYPESALKKNVSGMVIVSFVVVKDGSITDIKLEKTLDPDCDKEALRLVKSMPRWIPGDLVRYYLPIRFSPPQK